MAGHSNEQTEDTEATTKKNQKIWSSIVKNYEMIQGAQLSNSFILLMVLNEAREPLTTTQITELISKRSKGEIYKIAATLRDSLEQRLKREGYVEGIEVKNKGLYSITPKGQKLLSGWIVFLRAYSFYMFQYLNQVIFAFYTVGVGLTRRIMLILGNEVPSF